MILAWADAWQERTGEWPNSRSGAIPETPGETWLAVETALRMGLCGFPGGATLARFVAEHRGRDHLHKPPQVTIDEILTWSDDWHDRTGEWPCTGLGTIPGKGGMTWAVINNALTDGWCSLPGGNSLACLLEEHRGVRNRAHLPL